MEIPYVQENYLRQIMALPHVVTPASLLLWFFLSLARIAPIVSMAPFLGSKLPGGVKMGLATSLAILFFPMLVGDATHTIVFDIAFVSWMLKELILGFILGYFAALPFYIAQSSGALVDFMRGSSSLQVTDPTTQAQTSSLGVLCNYILIVIFFKVDGLFFFLHVLTNSYQLLPVDQLFPYSFLHLQTSSFWHLVAATLSRVALISIQLSAPSIVAILMAEVFLGIANRLAPQVQIVFLGMPLKSILGIGLLWVSWTVILDQMGKQALDWFRVLSQGLLSLGL